jgi:AAA family ATP:ADP antiporter
MDSDGLTVWHNAKTLYTKGTFMTSINKKPTENPVPMGKWRERFFPVYSHELKKFMPMVAIMFCTLFMYTIVRTIKDSMLVNAPGVDPKVVLSTAKLFFVTPASILFVIFYAKMSNRLSKNGLYYTTLVPFVLFFFLFAFVIYPNRFTLHASTETIMAWKKGVLGNISPIVGYWTYTLFYMMAELWGNVGTALLFWQLANRINPTSEAKRFYPIYGFWSNLALVSAGFLLKYADPIMRKWTKILPDGKKDFSMEVKLLCSAAGIGGIIMGLSYWWLNKYVLSDPNYAGDIGTKKKKKKPKLSIGESLRFLMHSRYLGYITILVLSYGVTINLVEISWKASLKEYFGGDESLYNAFMSNLWIYTGLSTMFLIAFSQNIMRLFGWRIAASITPIVSLITGGLFFVFILFGNMTAGICQMLFASTPVTVAVWLGLIQNILAKGAKYSLFDPTKEMAYIPLDEESKVKGKAAIDVIGGRAGKSGGSVINIAASMVAHGHAFTATVGVIMSGICIIWYTAVQKLSGEYQKKLAEQKDTE